MELVTQPPRPGRAPLGEAPVPGMDGEIRRLGTPRIVGRREAVYGIGDPAEHAYFLERGTVTLSRLTADGRELILETLGPGDLFGETELMLGQARMAQALASTECVVYVLSRAALLQRVAGSREAGWWLNRKMGERQARLQQRMETLLFTSAPGKVAQVLLSLAERHGKPAAGGTLIDHPITHQEIGTLIATTRETVSYAFMDFRRHGFIATRRRRTIIRDAAALGAIARR